MRFIARRTQQISKRSIEVLKDYSYTMKDSNTFYISAVQYRQEATHRGYYCAGETKSPPEIVACILLTYSISRKWRVVISKPDKTTRSSAYFKDITNQMFNFICL
jgi:hypothetical protein